MDEWLQNRAERYKDGDVARAAASDGADPVYGGSRPFQRKSFAEEFQKIKLSILPVLPNLKERSSTFIRFS
ncbi:hypothetical protein NC651_019611 [Populus alba x Populus x berolinensis]|nr:hypothetical protein NC651_019611 [Populus alba x Populus x berolinensis]